VPSCATCGRDLLVGAGFCRACGASTASGAPSRVGPARRPVTVGVIAILFVGAGAWGVGMVTLTTVVLLSFALFPIPEILALFAISWFAVAAGIAAWRGKRWARAGMVGATLAAAALQIYLAAKGGGIPLRALSEPVLVVTLFLGAFCAWYALRAEARAWFVR